MKTTTILIIIIRYVYTRNVVYQYIDPPKKMGHMTDVSTGHRLLASEIHPFVTGTVQ